MGVGIDAECAAELESATQPAPIKVEPPRVAVHFDRDAVLGAGPEHALNVEFVARAAQQLAARHMADNRDERVRCSTHQALGLSLGVEAELAVDAADDEIE